MRLLTPRQAARRLRELAGRQSGEQFGFAATAAMASCYGGGATRMADTCEDSGTVDMTDAHSDEKGRCGDGSAANMKGQMLRLWWGNQRMNRVVHVL